MWRERSSGRSSAGSEVGMIDHPASSLRMSDIPNVASLNVTNSPQFHLGPKIYNVNQTIHQSEVIKDLPMPSYLCTLLKSTTRTERISCAAAVAALIIFITLVTYFSIHRNKNLDSDDDATHEWNITREMWLARPYNYTYFTYGYEPLKLVIVQHTVGGDCYTFTNCAAELRTLQNYFIDYKGYDIPYNFLVGNDGRIYEGRGWSVEGAHTFGFNKCTIGLGFIGDYRQNAGTQHSKVTEAQLNRTLMLLQESVRLGFLHKDYFIVAAMDLQSTESPGDNLYKALLQWEHYDHKNRFYKKNCDEIEEIFAQR
ncbi:peptidoglycan recognition protein-like isoform X2 [Plodia interpunctella]|uniref:peptidoglycan recognition protein-like isoform X2 n=1 Tax=Plodia interpunctella TaxID=58824 RepID=UPI0023681EC8|nr:peptidoglycan recognition protein-like isoform X2 [Plodia interpunctella]